MRQPRGHAEVARQVHAGRSTPTRRSSSATRPSDLSESQPTKGNIAGGLTTIEEKAFGNLQKIGKKTKFIDVLKPAEAPAKGPGLYYMDTSSAAAECVTLQAAAGFVVHLFPTGQGNVIGNPIEPVIKLTANPKTARTMVEHIDLDVSGHPAARDDARPGGRSAHRHRRSAPATAGSRARRCWAIASSC